MLRDRYEGLTRAQRQLADHIGRNLDHDAFMTARELAASAGVSEAAVVRFAQALGFPGYPQLRSALRAEVLARLGASGTVRSRAMGRDTPAALIAEGFELDRQLIAATARLNDPTAFERLADRMLAARRIWLTAHGTSYPMAHYLAMKLAQMLGNTELLTVGVGDLAERLAAIEPGDLLLGISLVRYYRYTLEILERGRERGAFVVAVTDSLSAPAARLSDLVLLVARDGVTTHLSEIGVLAAVNAALAALTVRGAERAEARLGEYDALLRRLGIVEAKGDVQEP